MQITLKREADRIDFISESGATVAYLPDGGDAIKYDTLADTAEAFGLIPTSYQEFIEAQGLDAPTARAIVIAGADMGTIR